MGGRVTTVHQDALFPVMLPDSPGYVHGIKNTDPWVIQCDGCGLTHTKEDREPLVTFLGRIIFNLQHDGGESRMCPDCWKHHGWIDRSPHAGWEHL